MVFSFGARRRTMEVQRRMRRIADRTVPNHPHDPNVSDRSEDRYNRSIPLLICPWENGAPRREDHCYALTVDLSDTGAGLVMYKPYDGDEVVLAFWIPAIDMEEPWYFLGRVQRNQPLGGGFWTLGVTLHEFANDEHRAALQSLVPLVEGLAPVAVASH